MRKTFPFSARGFTLTELAVVLVIISLLIGGLLIPLGTQDDLRKVSDTQKSLNEIRDALIAFAAKNKRLPCPMALTTTDPNSSSYGLEDSTQCTTEGFLPWKTLGLGERDAWGSPRSTSSDKFIGFWRYRADSAFDATSATITTSLSPTDNLSIQNANNIALTDSKTVVAIVYSTGPNLTQDGANATLDTVYQSGERSGSFDDQLVWISQAVLVGRLLSAGALP